MELRKEVGEKKWEVWEAPWGMRWGMYFGKYGSWWEGVSEDEKGRGADGWMERMASEEGLVRVRRDAERGTGRRGQEREETKRDRFRRRFLELLARIAGVAMAVVPGLGRRIVRSGRG